MAPRLPLAEMVTKFSIYRMTVSGWTEAFSLPLGKRPTRPSIRTPSTSIEIPPFLCTSTWREPTPIHSGDAMATRDSVPAGARRSPTVAQGRVCSPPESLSRPRGYGLP